MDRNALLDYALSRYGAEPEYLWANLPDAYVLRHQNNRKWFAVGMAVPREKMGLSGEGSVEVLDLKCGPLLGGSYVGRPGILPAYHMNKEHWLSLLLDGTADDGDIRELLEISYDLTKGKN